MMLSVVVIVLLMVPWRALCKWRPKPFEGMEVNHFSSGRRGTVVRVCVWDEKFMWIWFADEGVILRRRVNAFPPLGF